MSRKKNKIKKVTKKITKDNKILNYIVFFSVMLVLHFSFVVLFNSNLKGYNILNRTWGFDHISYFPSIYLYIFYIISLIVIIPFTNNYIKNILHNIINVKLSHIVGFLKKNKTVLFLTISLFFTALFYFFKIKYHFLGDMDIRINQTLKEEYIKDEYLTMLLLNKFHLLLNNFFGFSGYQTFVTQSVISGFVFVFVSLLIADVIVDEFNSKISVFLFYISFGTLLLFFGYVEIYSIPAMSVLIYLYAAILSLKRDKSIVFAFVALLVSIMFHLMSIGLLPSFLLLVYLKNTNKFKFLNKIKLSHVIIAVVLSLPIIYFLALKLSLAAVIPFTKVEDTRVLTLFSLKHLWEFTNNQLLASGVGILLLIIIIYKAFKEKIKPDSTILFLSVAAIYIMLITFIVNKMRGSGDWDIVAFPSIIFNLLVVSFYVNILSKKYSKSKISYILVVAIAFNFLNASSWIAVNATDMSIKKIANMLETDPAYYYQVKLPAETNLALSYRANGLDMESIKYYKKAYKKHYKDPRSHFNYAMMLIKIKDEKKAAQILDNLIDIMPLYPMAYEPLLTIYEKNKQYDKMYTSINKMYNAYVKNPKPLQLRMNKNFIISCFTYLYKVENSKGNKQKTEKLQQILISLGK